MEEQEIVIPAEEWRSIYGRDGELIAGSEEKIDRLEKDS